MTTATQTRVETPSQDRRTPAPPSSPFEDERRLEAFLLIARRVPRQDPTGS